jgi:hypothetical protein
MHVYFTRAAYVSDMNLTVNEVSFPSTLPGQEGRRIVWRSLLPTQHGFQLL